MDKENDDWNYPTTNNSSTKKRQFKQQNNVITQNIALSYIEQNKYRFDLLRK